MDTGTAFEKLLEAYSVYYDINKDEVPTPFEAVAVFSSMQEQYFMVRSAKLSEAESSEHVYFIHGGHTGTDRIAELSDRAWEEGLKKATPSPDHKSSDVILIMIADSMDASCESMIRGINYSKAYKLGFHGFSTFKLAVIDAGAEAVYCNRQGHDVKKQIEGILGFGRYKMKGRK